MFFPAYRLIWSKDWTPPFWTWVQTHVEVMMGLFVLSIGYLLAAAAWSRKHQTTAPKILTVLAYSVLLISGCMLLAITLS